MHNYHFLKDVMPNSSLLLYLLYYAEVYYLNSLANKGISRKISRGGATENRSKNSTIKPLPGGRRQ